MVGVRVGTFYSFFVLGVEAEILREGLRWGDLWGLGLRERMGWCGDEGVEGGKVVGYLG